MRGMLASLLVLGLAAAACGGDDGTTDAGGQDAVIDPGPADEGAGDPGPADPGPADVGPDAVLDPSVFTFRVPQEREVPRILGGEEVGKELAWDIDYLCRLPLSGTPALVYVQTTPKQLGSMGDPTIFEVSGAWISTGGAAQVLPGTTYDYGGNHHNDFVQFEWAGTGYKVYHSSFGAGWHACQPPDCVQVLDGDGRVAQNGCGDDRTIPATCVQVANDGTVPPLVDTFEPCT